VSRTKFSRGARHATDEQQLQPLLRNAIVSSKMVVEIEKGEKATPQSPLVEIWKCTAKAAHTELHFRSHQRWNVPDTTAAKLGNNL